MNGELSQVLASVDTLREAWEVSLDQVSAAEFAEARRRSLRRHCSRFTERATRAEALAGALHKKVVAYVEELGSGVRDQFREADSQAYSSIDHAEPSDVRARYWQKQIVRTAREVDIFTNLGKGSWWTRLHLIVLGQKLRFVVVIQRVGHGETGVLAVTVFAEAVTPRTPEDDDRPLPIPLFRSMPADSVTLVFSDDSDARWAEVCELIDKTLAAAVAKFAQQLG